MAHYGVFYTRKQLGSASGVAPGAYDQAQAGSRAGAHCDVEPQQNHVGNVLRKLALTTRTEVAVWLWKHGLVEEEAGSGGFPPEKIG